MTTAKGKPEPEPEDIDILPMAFGAAGGIDLRLDTSPEAMSQAILERLFEADSLDDAFATWEPGRASDNLVGKSYEVTAVSWTAYETESGQAIPLARVTATDLDTGEVSKWVTTAQNVTAFLALAEAREWLPVKFKIGSVKSRRGFDVLRPERIS